MSDHIPTEIVIEILARLPVETLLRFTVVCKLWYSIITNPRFITTHSNQFGRRITEQVLFRLYTNENKKERYLLLHDDEKFGENYTELDFPFNNLLGYFRIVGTCNGLVCLCDDYFQDAKEVIVWNPCIRKSVTITLPEKPPNPYMCVIGFGFDLATNVFKIVKLMYEKECLNQCKVPPEVEVYEQGRGEWRGIKCAAPQYCLVDFVWSQVFLHKSVHWIVYDPSIVGGFHNVIIGFEMGDEVFNAIELPHDLASERSTFLSPSILKDSLAVLCWGSGRGTCSVWEMRDYGVFESWTNLYNVVLPGVSRVLGFKSNGEILFTSITGTIGSYDDKTKALMYTSIKGSSYSLKVQHFVESLVLLERENDIPDCFSNLILCS